MFRSLLLIGAALIVLSLGHTANAQAISYSLSPRAGEDPVLNNYLSARYDFLLQTSPRFRTYRMWKECHTINFPPLHGSCIASFDLYEPIIPEYYYRRA